MLVTTRDQFVPTDGRMLRGFNGLPKRGRLALSLRKVRIDRQTVTQVITDHCVNVRQRDRRERACQIIR
jgi:hypothetical protein